MEDNLSFQGRYYRFKDLTVVPRPVQKPHPPLYTGGTSVQTYEMAGRRGWGVFLPPLLPFAAMKPSIDAYLAAAEKAGHPPNLVYIRPCYLGDDPKQIEHEVKPFLHNFLAFNASPVRGLPAKEELIAKGYGFYASGALESLTKLTYQQIVEQEIGFIGTPEQVAGQIQRLQKQAPIAELALVTNFGGLPHWQVIKTQDLFARQVLPAFRQ
jgi:alkanesulfonate monooxygenase SsuD/methylene tetrahydromethanopterin reductase-like flavin-dependent oxidoreductase (luciferase family)